MKTLTKLFSVLILLVMIGCAEDSNLVSPADTMNENIDINKVNWISLPLPDDMLAVNRKPQKDPTPADPVSSIFTASKTINGKRGGTIRISDKYEGGIHGHVEVEASLQFEKESFDGEKLVTMTINDQNGCADFSPSSQFYKPAKYVATIRGLDLTDVDPESVRFVYQAEDGSIETIFTAYVEVDISTGTLKVQNAKLPHFSRFGFVN